MIFKIFILKIILKCIYVNLYKFLIHLFISKQITCSLKNVFYFFNVCSVLKMNKT